MTSQPNLRLRDNIARVRGEIAEAAARSGRAVETVKLVAVTKYVDVSLTRQVAALVADIGESRPQEIWGKAPELSDLKLHWHLIGHLQRNKIRRTLPHVSLIHSVDNLRLVEELQAECARIGRVQNILLEVNISGDASKTGFAAQEMQAAISAVAACDHLALHGLMSMSGLDTDAAAAQQQFAAVRNLRDELQRNLPGNVSLRELSMGMSGDFREAIAEGATLVRIGSSLFEGIL